MNKIHIFLFASIVMFVSGCNSVPIKDMQFDAQADPKAKFSAYKSYAWLGTAAIINDSYGQWEPPEFDADNEIKFLIDRELRKRGMSEDSVAPDLFISFAAGVDMDALGLKKEPDTQMKILDNVPQGGLVLAILDSDTGFVIWIGSVIGEVQPNMDAKSAKARLDYAVTQLLKKMPK
ncbi:MAG: DUF4136 domain-containing protein [Gammaproteobacteria bacterium]